MDYAGPVSLAELEALAAFCAHEPTWLAYDCLNLVTSSADFQRVSFTDLDATFARYRTLYRPLNFLIVRRSAWLCQSGRAAGHVAYWTGDRDTRESFSSDVRQFDSFESAGEWLLLRPDELADLKNGEGFAEIFHFEAPSLARVS